MALFITAFGLSFQQYCRFDSKILLFLSQTCGPLFNVKINRRVSSVKSSVFQPYLIRWNNGDWWGSVCFYLSPSNISRKILHRFLRAEFWVFPLFMFLSLRQMNKQVTKTNSLNEMNRQMEKKNPLLIKKSPSAWSFKLAEPLRWCICNQKEKWNKIKN